MSSVALTKELVDQHLVENGYNSTGSFTRGCTTDAAYYVSQSLKKGGHNVTEGDVKNFIEKMINTATNRDLSHT